MIKMSKEFYELMRSINWLVEVDAGSAMKCISLWMERYALDHLAFDQYVTTRVPGLPDEFAEVALMQIKEQGLT